MNFRYIRSFELLSFELTDGFMAVFADIASDGITDLIASPIQAIGLAKVTTRHVKEGVVGHVNDTYNELVGLSLTDGVWEIENECSNFAGLMQVGGEVLKSAGSLDRSEYKTLRVNPESHEEDDRR